MIAIGKYIKIGNYPESCFRDKMSQFTFAFFGSALVISGQVYFFYNHTHTDSKEVGINENNLMFFIKF